MFGAYQLCRQTESHRRGFVVPIAFCFCLLLRPTPTISQSRPIPKLEDFKDVHRVYRSDFNYDPSSKLGPLHWDEVDVSEDEHHNWGDFDVFEGSSDEKHSLGIEDNECDSKRRPSPINLRANTPCTDTHEILTRRIKEGDCDFHDLTFEIAPHVLRANMPYNDDSCLRPKIDLPNGFGSDWLLVWMEFHVRSDHVVDGRRYDGEINFIHVGLNGQKDDLAVPSVLLDASGTVDEPRLQRFIDKWQAIADKVRLNCAEKQRRRGLGIEVSDIKRVNKQNEFGGMLQDYRSNISEQEGNYDGADYYGSDTKDANIERLRSGGRLLQKKYAEPRDARRKQFPYDMWPTIHYYRYKGSIVYPPCSEIVQWRVFDEPLVISRRQFKQLATLLSSYIDEDTCENKSVASPTGENYRPVQKLNDEEQVVTHCTIEDFTYWQYPFKRQ